ncbi:MAG: GntR family transcriptional regulator [Acidobacteriota bacterium]
MDFHIEKHSSTPVAKQIEEQIKLAVMMGIFRDGDTLPSIREIERQTGVNRSQIHKAYQDLRKSGLLVLTRGKGSVVSTSTDYPQSLNKNCSRLSNQVLSKVRKLGISPTAFARYLNRHAQKSERDEPYIIYVDTQEKVAAQQASEISKLWRVPVSGQQYKALEAMKEAHTGPYKILVNHVMCEYVRSLAGDKADVIPVEVRYSSETMRRLSEINPHSSVKLLVLPHPLHRVRFMMEQTRRLIKSSDVAVTTVTIRNTEELIMMLESRQYDYCILGPALRGDIPEALRSNPKIIPMDPKFDPVSLENARIRAGVII